MTKLRFVLHQVDAHGLRGDLVVPDGLERAAVGGVDEQHDEPDAHARDEERHHGVQFQRAQMEAREACEVVEQVGAVRDGPQLLILDDGADDLRKAEGRDGQVVGFEPQHRQADQRGKARRHEAAQNQADDNAQQLSRLLAQNSAETLRDRKADAAVRIALIDQRLVPRRNGQDGGGVRAQHHEARLPQREEAGKAVQKVHRNRHEGQNRALLQHESACMARIRCCSSRQATRISKKARRYERMKLSSSLFIPSHLIRSLFAEEARGHEQEHDDQQDEREGVREGGQAAPATRAASKMPIQKPPTIAPGIEPMPPKTAATKHLRPGSVPLKG